MIASRMHLNQRNGFPCRCEDCEQERREQLRERDLDPVHPEFRHPRDTKMFCDCGESEYWCTKACPMPTHPPQSD